MVEQSTQIDSQVWWSIIKLDGMLVSQSISRQIGLYVGRFVYPDRQLGMLLCQ